MLDLLPFPRCIIKNEVTCTADETNIGDDRLHFNDNYSKE